MVCDNSPNKMVIKDCYQINYLYQFIWCIPIDVTTTTSSAEVLFDCNDYAFISSCENVYSMLANYRLSLAGIEEFEFDGDAVKFWFSNVYDTEATKVSKGTLALYVNGKIFTSRKTKDDANFHLDLYNYSEDPKFSNITLSISISVWFIIGIHSFTSADHFSFKNFTNPSLISLNRLQYLEITNGPECISSQ